MLGPATKWGLLAAGIVVLAPCILFAILSWTSRRPSTLGPSAGKLRACPDSPNCVCSCETAGSHAIAPLIWTGTPQAGLERLKRVIASLPGGHCDPIEAPGYLHAEFTSAWFRFVDDVEFLVDTAAGIIHVRSASRVGHSDLGVNRRRVEQIRALFQASD